MQNISMCSKLSRTQTSAQVNIAQFETVWLILNFGQETYGLYWYLLQHSFIMSVTLTAATFSIQRFIARRSIIIQSRCVWKWRDWRCVPMAGKLLEPRSVGCYYMHRCVGWKVVRFSLMIWLELNNRHLTWLNAAGKWSQSLNLRCI